MAMRTKAGTVTAEARRRAGARGGGPLRAGSFPVFDAKSAESALRLRGHAPTAAARAAVIDRVMRWARKTNNRRILDMAKTARARDRSA